MLLGMQLGAYPAYQDRMFTCGPWHHLLSYEPQRYWLLLLAGGVWYARYPAAIAARCSSMSYGVRTATRWQPGAPNRVGAAGQLGKLAS